MSKIVVTECTSESGGFFVFALLSHLGCDTGFTFDENKSTQEVQGGLHAYVFNPSLPTNIHQAFVGVDIDYIILPIRDYFAWAEWKRKEEPTSNKYYERLPAIHQSIATFLYEITVHDIPTIFLDFDRMISDACYMYECLRPVLDKEDIDSLTFCAGYRNIRKHAIQHGWLEVKGAVTDPVERRLLRQKDLMLFLHDQKEHIYTYTHRYHTARGCTNQVFLMLNSICTLEMRKIDSVVFLDKFYAQFNNDASRIPWSDIIDLQSVNIRLNHVLLVDPWRVDALLSWGKDDDPSSPAVRHRFIVNEQPIPLRTLPALLFNQLTMMDVMGHGTFDDPVPLEPKTFYVKLCKMRKCIMIPEWAHRMVLRSLEDAGDGLSIPDNGIVGKILEKLRFNVHISKFPQVIHTLQSTTRIISVVHLRNEESDAIGWWSKQNKMTTTQFERLLTAKYVGMIEKHIPSSHLILVLTTRTFDNPVLKKIKKQGYEYVTKDDCDVQKREVMAMYDLSIATTHANGILLCPAQASTFSKWLMLRLKSQVERVIVFDLNRIHDKEIVLPIRS